MGFRACPEHVRQKEGFKLASGDPGRPAQEKTHDSNGVESGILGACISLSLP